jgi:hypothetical protein
MSVVIGPVLRHAEAYSFDTWTAGKGVSGGAPYRRIEDAYYARNAEIKASARGRAPVCDRLPDPRRVHREIQRLRDARRRMTEKVASKVAAG